MTCVTYPAFRSFLLSCLTVAFHVYECFAVGVTLVKGTPQVLFSSRQNASPVIVTVEVPHTEQEFARGLMFRKSLPQNHGMLFSFYPARPVLFWMKNTSISLDMIFIGEQGRVIWIEANTPPLDETPRGPKENVRYVVEVSAGFCRLHGIQVGTQMTLIDGVVKPKQQKTLLGGGE